MRKLLILTGLFMFFGCAEKSPGMPSAQEIVDRSIALSGGQGFASSTISFDFRDIHYEMEPGDSMKILKRVIQTDTARVEDILMGTKFQRYANDNLVAVADSMATRYANSVNSVHYFAYLPYGLNDRAVNKKLLGKSIIDGTHYYEVQVTFDKEGGGADYEDVYVYWFDTETYKPDYFAYKFYTDGGGVRFRKAYNERYIGGLRFVDYENYMTDAEVNPSDLDSIYQGGGLAPLSRIELENIRVNPGSGS